MTGTPMKTWAAQVDAMLRALTPREREVLAERFGVPVHSTHEEFMVAARAKVAADIAAEPEREAARIKHDEATARLFDAIFTDGRKRKKSDG